MWRERVDGWRRSGDSAAEFAAKGGFAPSSLRYWASRFRRRGSKPTRFVQLVTASGVASVKPPLLIEVGSVRIHVAPGFDGRLLAEVVQAISGSSR